MKTYFMGVDIESIRSGAYKDMDFPQEEKDRIEAGYKAWCDAVSKGVREWYDDF